MPEWMFNNSRAGDVQVTGSGTNLPADRGASGSGSTPSRTGRGRARWSSPNRDRAAPAVDTEVVRDLVHDRDDDLLARVLAVLAHACQRAAESRIVSGRLARPQPASRSVCGMPAEPQEVGVVSRCLVLDEEDDVVEQVEQVRRHLVERVGDQLLELLRVTSTMVTTLS